MHLVMFRICAGTNGSASAAIPHQGAPWHIKTPVIVTCNFGFAVLQEANVLSCARGDSSWRRLINRTVTSRLGNELVSGT